MGKFLDTNIEASYLDDYLFARCMDVNYDGLWTNAHSTYDTIIWRDGVTIPLESEFDAKLAELTAEYESTMYARSRKEEYDALNQFEMQFDDEENETTTWKDAVNAIKAKYPKP